VTDIPEGQEQMSDEIQLVSDDDGLAIIGNPTDVERFLISEGLDKLPSRDLGLQRFGKTAGRGAVVMQTGSAIATGSGRWVQITEESAQLIKKYGLMRSKDTGLRLGVVQPHGDKIKGIVQFARGPGSILANPAILAGAAGIMAQFAIQQQMEQIVEYLQEINEKVDDVLRSQTDAVLSDMIGAGWIIEEAWTVREEVGRVSEVNWSKIQGIPTTIASTQEYALRQLDAIAEKLHTSRNAGEIAKAAREAEVKIREWLAVLARCFQLQDATYVLELDRMLEASPEELEQHRLGLSKSRQRRRELIIGSTDCLLTEMGETVRRANSKVLFSPFSSPAAVRSSNQVSADVLEFRGRLGIESNRQAAEAKRWGEAATETRDMVLRTTAEGLDATRRFSADTFSHAVDACRAVDLDGDGIPDKPRALSAVEDGGAAMKGAAVAAGNAIGAGAKNAGSAIGGLLAGTAGKVGSLVQRKKDSAALLSGPDSETGDEPSALPDE
jgi:hypothetical protein